MTLLKEYSCGVIPFKIIDREIHYLIVSHRCGHWGFPKGHQEAGENDEQTALRELREEGGVLRCDLLKGITFEDHYRCTYAGREYDKTVKYFLGEVREEASTWDDPDSDISMRCWKSYGEAGELLTHESVRNILRQANDCCANYFSKTV